jgi:hypothetical protein
LGGLWGFRWCLLSSLFLARGHFRDFDIGGSFNSRVSSFVSIESFSSIASFDE